MKILVISGQWYPDDVGGVGRVARATAESLAQRGHAVTLLIPRAGAAPALSIVNGVRVHRALRRSILPQTFTDIYEVRRALRSGGLGRPDVILAHGDTCATAALSAGSPAPTALVFHASGYRESRHRRATGLGAIERWRALSLEPALHLLERYALRRANRILTLSAFSRSLVLDELPAAEPNVEVVGGGVDTAFFSPARSRDALRQRLGISSDRSLLLTVRRLVSRMGVDTLIDAVALLRDRMPLQLVIVGDGELRRSLEEHRDRLGLRDSIRFVGRASDDALRDWYRAADLFVLPTVAYEGFGMVTAEALACGTPVVGTRVGATAELLTPLDEGLLTTAADARSLAETVAKVLLSNNIDRRADCRRYAEQSLSWNAVIQRWEAALADLPAD